MGNLGKGQKSEKSTSTEFILPKLPKRPRKNELTPISLLKAIGVSAIMISCLSFVLMIRPPVAIFLGTSHPVQIKMAGHCRGGIFPFRLVAFIQATKGDFANFAMNGDCLRVSGNEDWRQPVFQLIDEVSFVVIDIRTCTDMIEEEILYLKKSDVIYKTVVLVDFADHLRAPIPDALQGAAVIDIGQARKLLGNCIFTHGNEPSRDMPISNIINSTS